MSMKTMAVSAGIGAAAGMAAGLMIPKNTSARKLAARAVNKMEDAAWKVTDTISEKMDM